MKNLELLEGYEVFESIIKKRIEENTLPLFKTDIDPDTLWNSYIDNLPRRQHYNCNCCKRFIQTFGGLVTMDGPLLWGGIVPDFFSHANSVLDRLVSKAKVNGVFLSSDAIWGIPVTKIKATKVTWTHLSGKNKNIFKELGLTAEQKMAEKLQDYQMLEHAFRTYSKETVATAVKLLKSETLQGSEKALAIAEWFLSLYGQSSKELWLSVATAPAGFCHIRSTMISTLLDDIVSGDLSYEVIQERWDKKMHPLKYMQPTAPPKLGNIKQAEDLVEKLGVARSLLRKFARFEDIQVKLWESRSKTVFGHLKHLPSQNISWTKFQRTILPDASEILILVPSLGSFYGLVTAFDSEAPNILQWDNPVSWYFYHGGSNPARWGLRSNSLYPVRAIFEAPHKWSGKTHANQVDTIFLNIELSHDQDVSHSGLALFPSLIRSEYHGIRSVIEAHSSTGVISGHGNANGLAFNKTGVVPTVLKVDGTQYTIDRWD